MQQFFQNLQGKIWEFIVFLFDGSLDFTNTLWYEQIKPFIEKNFNIIVNFANKIIEKIFQLSNKILNTIDFEFFFNLMISQYKKGEQLLDQLSIGNKNLYYAVLFILILVIVFWLAMIRHAYKAEVWKKTWIFLITILGPLGAALYYFFRKRKAEAILKRNDKVMMSFFSPMNRK